MTQKGAPWRPSGLAQEQEAMHLSTPLLLFFKKNVLSTGYVSFHMGYPILCKILMPISPWSQTHIMLNLTEDSMA